MKKLTQIVAAIVLSVAFVGTVSTVQAQEAPEIDLPNCDVLVIDGTGPDSENEIVCTTDIKVNVECVNKIYVLTENSQEALSGAAVVGGNVTGGTAITGNATNENDTTVQIGAACGQEEQGEQGGQGAPAVVTSAEVPGAGAGGAGAAAPQHVAALPFTAGSSTLETAAISAIVLATAFTTVRLAVAAYRRQALKQ
jgi:hypothetical protein